MGADNQQGRGQEELERYKVVYSIETDDSDGPVTRSHYFSAINNNDAEKKALTFLSEETSRIGREGGAAVCKFETLYQVHEKLEKILGLF